AAEKVGGQAKAAGDRRAVGGWARTASRWGWPARTRVVEPLAEAPESRRECGIVGRLGLPFSISTRAVAHALDTRKKRKKIGPFPTASRSARTILTGSHSVKNAPFFRNNLRFNDLDGVSRAVIRKRCRVGRNDLFRECTAHGGRTCRAGPARLDAIIGTRRNAMRAIAAVLLIGLAGATPALAQTPPEASENG